jgi:hypothetical protein
MRYGVLTDTYRMKIDNAKEIKSANFPSEVSLQQYLARVPSDHFPVEIVLEYSK